VNFSVPRLWVRQVGLGILCQHKVGFERFFSELILGLILTLFLAGTYLQSDPISEDEFMTKWNPAIPVVDDTFISNTSLKLLTVSISIHFPPRTRYSNILLLLCGTSNRPCHAPVRRPLSHARALEGRTYQAVSVGHRGRHERP
jgi:hypothetical protein